MLEYPYCLNRLEEKNMTITYRFKIHRENMSIMSRVYESYEEASKALAAEIKAMSEEEYKGCIDFAKRHSCPCFMIKQREEV
jgi:hypothetical protein